MISVLSLNGSILPTTDPVFHLAIQEDVCLCVCVCGLRFMASLDVWMVQLSKICDDHDDRECVELFFEVY